MKIPLVDLKSQYESLKPDIDSAIQSILDETAFIGGPRLSKFEQEFASLLGAQVCIGCGNGTDSLYIILKMLGVGPGDEVITVGNSWISTSEIISQTGAVPVFVDVEPNYYTLDPALVEARITPKTRAVIPVHLYGQACRIDAIQKVCDRHSLFLIEDCAQAHLAEFQGHRVGLFGQAGSFSFYPGKNLGAYGDAGCIVTNDQELGKKCRMYANHGALVKHEHQIEGINSRLDTLQAAILSVKLPHLEEWTEARIRNAAIYRKFLEGVSEIVLPAVRPETKHVFHLFVIQAERRDDLADHLSSLGVQTGLHYPTPLPFLPCYSRLNHSPEDFPVIHSLSKRILSLPMFPELTQDQLQFVANGIKEFYSREGR